MSKYFMKKWHNFVNKQKDSSKIAKIVMFSGDKILLLVSTHPDFKGKLDLPGGHIQYNEEITEGLRREVKEETGLVVTDYRKLYEHGNLNLFWGMMPKGDVVLSDEHSGYHLLTVDEITKKGYSMTKTLYDAVIKAYELMHKS
jgi:8-oxo-dGTP pyrophosphatase MutT (NUDIX family)